MNRTRLSQIARLVHTLFVAAMLSAAFAHAEKLPDIEPGFALRDMQRLSAEVYVAQLAPTIWVHTTVGILDDGSKYLANGILLEDGDTSVLFDAGWTSEEAEVLLRWARSVLKHPVSRAYVTHFHRDRLGGIGALEKQHIPVFATEMTLKLADKTQPLPDHSIGVPSTPTRVAKDAFILFPGAGHTRDNLVVDFPAENAIYGGCFLKAGDAASIGYVADADLRTWPESILRMQSLFPDAGRFIPGHGPISADSVRRTLKLLKR